MPKVSVIIPCYNLGRYLDEAVDSVLAQTFRDFEVVIVNDGSTDEFTNNLLSVYDKPKTKVIVTENQGLAAARNNGIAVAEGKYICCLDADDKYHPEFLEKTLSILDADETNTYGFVTTWVTIFGEHNVVWKTSGYNPFRLAVENVVHVASLFRRVCWEDVKGYSTSLSGYQDWDFWLSIVAKGYKWSCIEENLFLYRTRRTSMINQSDEKRFVLFKQIIANHKDFYMGNYENILMYSMSMLKDLGSIGRQTLDAYIQFEQKSLTALQTSCQSEHAAASRKSGIETTVDDLSDMIFPPNSKRENLFEAASYKKSALLNKPKIALATDVEGWALSNIAKHIKNHLSSTYEIEIIYCVQYRDNLSALFKELFCRDFRLIHFFWRGHALDLYYYLRGLKREDADGLIDCFIRTPMTSSVYDHCLLEPDEIQAHRILFNGLLCRYTVCSERLYALYNGVECYKDPDMIIEDGVEPELFYPKDIRRLSDKNRAIIVGWAGDSKWWNDGIDHKGLETIIRPAIESLRNEGIPVVGKFADRNKTYIPLERMVDYYNSIDIYVCASDIEGTPNPVLEAMACGLPVISTNVGIVPEVFGQLQSEFILEERTPEALKERIRLLVDSPERRKALSEENLDRIKARTRKDESKKWDMFFKKALKDSDIANSEGFLWSETGKPISQNDLKRMLLFDAPELRRLPTERERVLSDLHRELFEKERLLMNLRSQTVEKDLQIQAFTDSGSWRITAPLRWLYSVVRKWRNCNGK